MITQFEFMSQSADISMVLAYGNTVAERATTREYIDWPAQTETGIPRIGNEQQKWLIALVASLDDSADEVHVISALALLSDYLRSHCQDDELQMTNEVDHPRGKAYRRLYREFQNMLSDLRRAHMMPLDEIASVVLHSVWNLSGCWRE